MASRVDLGSGAITFFTRRLRRAGSAARAVGEKAYLRSDLRFWGTSQDSIRMAVREYCDSHPNLVRTELRSVAMALYATDVHELRAAAIGVLERDRETLDDRDMSWLLQVVRNSKSWAYVDWIAPKVIGDVIARDPRARKRLAIWAKDKDFWVRRTALLAEHDALRAGGGDFALWSRLAGSMLDEREFFIRKAIGWVLREVSKKRPDLTYAFLRKHRDRVSRLSLLEGAKYLPAAQRIALGSPGKVPGPRGRRSARGPTDPKTGRARRMQPAKPWHGSVGRSAAGTVDTSRPLCRGSAPIAWNDYPSARGSALSRSSRSSASSRSAPRWSPRRRPGRSPSGPGQVRLPQAPLRHR